MSQIYKTSESNPAPGPILSLTTNDGSVVLPNGSGTIFVNDTALNTTGNVGAHSITIPSFYWTVTGSTAFTPANFTGYLLSGIAPVTVTLPVTPTVGYWFALVNVNGGISFTLAQNANDQITWGSQQTTLGAGGSITSTNAGDTLNVVCYLVGGNHLWSAFWSQGNMVVV
jgi:hypothetical protein